MRRIKQYCQQRLDHAAVNHPFINWIKDETIPVKERLGAWLPHLAVFAFAFKDLNNLLLPYPEDEASTDIKKRIINTHTKQDGTHWEWYLKDICTLGLNKDLRFSEGLEFLWHEDRKQDRLFLYQVCALIDEAKDPLLRYSIILPIEDFAHLLFNLTAKLAKTYSKNNGGIDLYYLGDTHSEVEPGGLVDENDEIRDDEEFLSVELSDDMYERALEISTFMCDELEKRWQGNYNYVTQKSWLSPNTKIAV